MEGCADGCRQVGRDDGRRDGWEDGGIGTLVDGVALGCSVGVALDDTTALGS